MCVNYAHMPANAATLKRYQTPCCGGKRGSRECYSSHCHLLFTDGAHTYTCAHTYTHTHTHTHTRTHIQVWMPPCRGSRVYGAPGGRERRPQSRKSWGSCPGCWQRRQARSPQPVSMFFRFWSLRSGASLSSIVWKASNEPRTLSGHIWASARCMDLRVCLGTALIPPFDACELVASSCKTCTLSCQCTLTANWKSQSCSGWSAKKNDVCEWADIENEVCLQLNMLLERACLHACVGPAK